MRGRGLSVIGKIRNDGQYIVHNGEEKIINAPAAEVTEGFLYDRPYEARKQRFTEPEILEPSDYNEILLKILSHENMASREPVFETYDKQVQGRIHTETGLADAGVMAPFNSEKLPGRNPECGNCFVHGSQSAVWTHRPLLGRCECRSGSHAECGGCGCYASRGYRLSLLWQSGEASPDVGICGKCPGSGGCLSRYHAKKHPDDATPIIAGNVSFYNESSNGAIPPSPIVSCLGRLKDVTKAVPMHFQTSDSILIMAGERRDELGGSVFYSLHDELGANVPQPNLEEVKNQIFALTDCINEGLVLSCHDIADGGVASTVVEMTFGNGIGCDITINSDLPTDKILFSETGGFVLEVSPENADAVLSNFSKYESDVFQVGTTGSNTIQINRVVDMVISDAKKTWANGLREKL